MYIIYSLYIDKNVNLGGKKLVLSFFAQYMCKEVKK